MSDDEKRKDYQKNMKRPAVSKPVYAEIRAIADNNMAFGAKQISWEKCLEVVIDEYVPGKEREKTAHSKGYADE